MIGYTSKLTKAIRLLLLISIAFLPGRMTAQSLKISARFDSTAIRIGDQVKLRLEVDMPPSAKVKLPTFKDTINGKIELVKVFAPDTVKTERSLHIRQDFLVTSFDSGFHNVASIAFPFEMGTQKDTLRSDILHLRVYTMKVDTTKDVRDLKPVYRASLSFAEVWPFLAIILGLALLGFGIWFLVKKLRKEPIFVQRKVLEPAHVIAIRELDKLRSEKLWQNNKTKLYYTQLTEIVRVYLEHRYNIVALEMTSDEIIDAFKNIVVEDPENMELLRKLFSTADLVKFAKMQPLPDENEISMLNAVQFVNNTKLISVTPVTTDEPVKVPEDEVTKAKE
jgi:hypothetical protein